MIDCLNGKYQLKYIVFLCLCVLLFKEHVNVGVCILSV